MKRRRKKKSRKDDSDSEKIPEKSKKSTENGIGNGRSDITLVDLEEEMNLEDLMKKKVEYAHKSLFSFVI